MTIDLQVGTDGSVDFIYNDAAVEILEEGESTVVRASHVEPCAGGWSADMGPSGGPVLGPFRTRQQALDEEVEWLKQNRNL